MTSTNKYGDLVCPHCNANIITPPGCDVVAGIGHCDICQRSFVVSAETAENANKGTDFFGIACELATNFNRP